MEIPLLRALLTNISSFMHSLSCENLTSRPVQKYYEKAEEILKLLKPMLDTIIDSEIASDELFKRAFEELGQSVDELRKLFNSWHSLSSKVYFALRVESLISKIRDSELDLFQLLKSTQYHLPDELNSEALEPCIQKVKHAGYAQMSDAIEESMNNQAEGARGSTTSLVKIKEFLNLGSNWELLIEAVALEKLKENAEQADNMGDVEYIDKMISFVTCMHDRFTTMKQTRNRSPVPIPADFCCPLSLELMTDPVIVASGQTYERAFIKNWIDLGLTVCPKTRQTLAHTNLIPNYTVKALIANWCESNNVKLPEAAKSLNLAHFTPLSFRHNPISNESTQFSGLSPKCMISSRGVSLGGTSSSHPCSSSDGSSLTSVAGNGHVLDMGRLSLLNAEERLDSLEERRVDLAGRSSVSPLRTEIETGGDSKLSHSHNRSDSASSTHSNAKFYGADDRPSSPTAVSGEVTAESPASSTGSTQRRELDLLSRLETRSRSHSIWLRPSERLVPRIVSSSAAESRADLSAIEAQVKKLVADLNGTSLDTQRDATAELRLLAKHNMENRIIIAQCGVISLLVGLLRSTDTKVQENSVTALLNLSINDNNKTAIANANAIEPLIYVLENGSSEAKENSAATLFSLSVIEDNKIRIGRSGAIRPLVNLLGSGTPRGKKDAATALFNLSIFHENKARIVQTGAVKYLVELMDPAAGMVDKAVAVLANLATIPEGRTAIGQEGGIPVLVEVVELGSGRGKENAAAALLQLCTNNSRFCSMVLQEGAVPPLVALSQSGTPRAREKAQALLSYFRNQRHGAGRG